MFMNPYISGNSPANGSAKCSRAKQAVPQLPDRRALPMARRPGGEPAARGRRRVMMLAVALALPLAVVAQAAPALASTPQVTITCAATNNCTATGIGFTPSGEVQVQAYAGTTVFSSSSLAASGPSRVCVQGLKPHCSEFPGGTFTAALPIDYGVACNATVAGTMHYTDVATGAAVSKAVTWTGPCASPTTTTLSIPSTVDTDWTAVNPASVTAGSTGVGVGTITITVNGVSVCSYTAGASSGCTLAELPLGTDQVQASYSGNAIPPYDSSSASETVNVIPVQPASPAQGSLNWAGYVDTGDTYTAVSGSWTVPAANCAGAVATASASWVGIDGGTSTDGTNVEQIGTDSNCVVPLEGNGSYWAWFEMAPSGPVVIGVGSQNYAVYPGDSMTASVTSTGTAGSYTLKIEDNTQGWIYSTTQSNPDATGATAECMEERPADLGLPLANFGSVTFTQCKAAARNGPETPIWDHSYYASYMNTTSGTQLAEPSALSDDGTQFTVTWLNGS